MESKLYREKRCESDVGMKLKWEIEVDWRKYIWEREGVYASVNA